TAMHIVEGAGADGITVHLRQDRRHIQDADLPMLRQEITTRLNLEMANTGEMVGIALRVKPDMVTLVPESPDEVTTQGGLDVVRHERDVAATIARFRAAGIHPSIFIDAQREQIAASKRAGAASIELCTAQYAEATSPAVQDREFDAIRSTARYAQELGLLVNVGHALDYTNTARIASIPGLYDFNIGHAIIIQAVFVGLERAVKDMVKLVKG
ncbi:MAG: pyridoxine 5'-phosphate synthase, partial [Candidatus Latescibacteria bacterium]|nr:pyridoxine 5'-phosphate synthase [Candidatus Latescibacterota bacterium]